MAVDYSSYVPAAQKKYLQMIYGPEGPGGYVSSQVRGAATAFQPYFRQMSTQGAAGVAGRGGAGGGGGDYLLSNLYGQKTGALTQAASQAESQVASTALSAAGLGLQEASQMSADERARLEYELRKAIFEWQKKQANKEFWGNLISDATRAGAYVAGGI